MKPVFISLAGYWCTLFNSMLSAPRKSTNRIMCVHGTRVPARGAGGLCPRAAPANSSRRRWRAAGGRRWRASGGRLPPPVLVLDLVFEARHASNERLWSRPCARDSGTSVHGVKH